jgi:hypothetical protein
VSIEFTDMERMKWPSHSWLGGQPFVDMVRATDVQPSNRKDKNTLLDG